MTSAQIRQAMKMTIDLAPAIGRAAEIVESAEQAESLIMEADVRRKAIEDEITSLRESIPALRDGAAKVATDLEQAKQAADIEKASLNKQLGAIQEKIDAAKSALETTRAEHAAFMQSTEAERILAQSELDGIKRDMETVLNKLRN